MNEFNSYIISKKEIKKKKNKTEQHNDVLNKTRGA